MRIHNFGLAFKIECLGLFVGDRKMFAHLVIYTHDGILRQKKTFLISLKVNSHSRKRTVSSAILLPTRHFFAVYTQKEIFAILFPITSSKTGFPPNHLGMGQRLFCTQKNIFNKNSILKHCVP